MSEYETDILMWSEHQTALLRLLSEGRGFGGNEIDWPNIIEEIEAVGRSELRAIESLLFQGLVHRLKAQAWPSSETVPHWQAEARGFLLRTRRTYTPRMTQRIDLASLYADALKALPDTVGGEPPLAVPAACPMSLEELLAG